MKAEEPEKKKTAEIAKLAKAFRKVTVSMANLFKTLERPSVKLANEIDNFYWEACEKKANHTVIDCNRSSYKR
tara:strand:+ start:124 stop:342 length:219 start_codon:yes stop_codon:yes gene_type:complete